MVIDPLVLEGRWLRYSCDKSLDRPSHWVYVHWELILYQRTWVCCRIRLLPMGRRHNWVCSWCCLRILWVKTIVCSRSQTKVSSCSSMVPLRLASWASIRGSICWRCQWICRIAWSICTLLFLLLSRLRESISRLWDLLRRSCWTAAFRCGSCICLISLCCSRRTWSGQVTLVPLLIRYTLISHLLMKLAVRTASRLATLSMIIGIFVKLNIYLGWTFISLIKVSRLSTIPFICFCLLLHTDALSSLSHLVAASHLFSCVVLVLSSDKLAGGIELGPLEATWLINLSSFWPLITLSHGVLRCQRSMTPCSRWIRLQDKLVRVFR